MLTVVYPVGLNQTMKNPSYHSTYTVLVLGSQKKSLNK